MAGGMNKRGRFGPMSERVGRSAAPPPAAPPALRHCWVTDSHGRLPALLLEWRSANSTWEGRVVHAVTTVDGWAVVEEWLPAEMLEPG